MPSLPQVETEDRFEWIGGSSIGGGTFWGLGALLTKTKVFPAEHYPSVALRRSLVHVCRSHSQASTLALVRGLGSP